MMVRPGPIAWLAIAVYVPLSSAQAETRYAGSIKVGYDVHDYTGSAAAQSGSNTLRQLFYHKIDFGLGSTLFAERVGNYRFNLSLQGFWDQSHTEFGRTSNYTEPDLRNYNAVVSLLPRTRIPFTLYATQQHYLSLDYETKNRYVVTTERPSLQVIRKYENKRQSVGGEMTFMPMRALSMRGMYEKSNTAVSRLYDYGEDRDIYCQIVPQQSPPGQPDYGVVFTNNLPETLTVYLDDTLLIQGLAPTGQLLVDIPTGMHRFDLRAPSFNSFSVVYDVSSNLLWVALYNPPATPNDRDATTGAAQFSALYEPGEKFRNELRLTNGEEGESIQGSQTSARQFNNNLRYKFNSRMYFQSLTNTSRLGSAFAGYDEEQQDAVSQFSTFNYVPHERTSAGVTHSYMIMTNRGLRTTINGIEAAGMRQQSHHYKFDLRVRMGRLNDTRGFEKEEFAAAIGNMVRDIDLKFAKSTLRDLFELKTSTEFNPGRAQHEYLNLLGFDNELGRLGPFGDLTLTVEYNTRRFYDVSGEIFESRPRFVANLINNVWSRLRLSGFLVKESSNITGSGSQAGTSTSSLTGRASFNLRLAQNVTLMGSYMFVDQVEVDINQYQTSFNAKVFMLPAWYTLSYDEQRKSFSRLDMESFRTFRQKLTFRWRQIDLLFQHEILFEDLRVGSSQYQGVRFEGQRGFDL